jgi:membrane-associated phospholipid phosphatase
MRNLFTIEKKPYKGLFAYEWIVAAYLLLTLIVIFFCYTKMPNAQAMIWGRVRVVVTTAAMILVYRLIPCRFTRLARATLQLALLSWWYPDTYEINRIFPNLDHLFVQWEQQLFGCQPAYHFSQLMPWPWFSELMDLGYVSYFPMIVTVVVFYFFFRYEEFHRTVFIILGAFFIYYVVFIFLPVTGPQYYYLAAGIDNISKGVFPNVGDYFCTHQEALPIPGWKEGFFYHMVEDAHAAGERPTAAFPSSHVGITMVLLCLAVHTRSWRLTAFIVPFFLLMFAATVYIQAHYLIDAIAGLLSGLLFFTVFLYSKQHYS